MDNTNIVREREAGEVTQEFNALGNNIEMISARLNALETAVRPVLRDPLPSNGEKVGGGHPSRSSELGRGLDELGAGTLRILERLEDLISRVAL
jgi:hypothetical protein